MGVRKNQNSLSAAEKTRYVEAVKQMKANPGAPYNYDQFVHLHRDVAASNNPDANPAHRGPAFCPWHRYLLLKFELALQEADRARGGDGGLTLPYWDWTHDDASSPNRQRGGMWNDDFLGGSGSPVSGPFRNFTMVALNPGDPTTLTREFGHAIAPTLPRDAEVQRALDCEGFDCEPFDDFNTSGGPGLPSPPAPAATAAAGGSLAAGTYSVVATYVNAPAPGKTGETRPSPAATVTVAASGTITVTSPPAQAGATGYRVYAAVGAATPQLQGGTTAFGTPVTIATLAAGTDRPSANTTSSFRNLLEGWVSDRGQPETHNRVHVWVGGSMGPGSSPNDPVFFLHHCNVDRLWALWQFRHPGQNYPRIVPRTDGAGNRPQGLDDPMPPWDSAPEIVRPSAVLKHTDITIDGRSLGYTYDTDPPGLAIDVSP